jgi:RNA polymerase sigma-70 factor (ECF subfamily)
VAVPGEGEWVRAARGGSAPAFSRLVQAHQAAVRAFLRRTLSGGWGEADDVAQETFVAAWQALPGLRDDQGFRSWLLGIAWRRAQDRIRSLRRGAARDHAWLDHATSTADASPADRIAVRQALADLPPDMRACIALCLADGWSHSEAAGALGLPVGTVKSHVARGRARLLVALGGADDA